MFRVLIRYAYAWLVSPLPVFNANLQNASRPPECQNLNPAWSEKRILRFEKLAAGPIVLIGQTLNVPMCTVPKLLASTTHESCVRIASLSQKRILSPSIVHSKLGATVMCALETRDGHAGRQEQHVTTLNVTVQFRVRKHIPILSQIISCLIVDQTRIFYVL